MPRSGVVARGRVPSPYPPTLPPRPNPEGYWGACANKKELTVPVKWVNGRWCQNCEGRLGDLKKQAIQMAIVLRSQMVRVQQTKPEASVTKRIYEKLHVPDSDTKIVQGCCEVCYTHVSQLKNLAVAMVQSLELSASQPASKIPQAHSSFNASHHHHVHHHLHQHHAPSKIPTPTSPCGSAHSPPGVRIPSPMPYAFSPTKRMSRQGKPSVPNPVAQQAQQYLEQNIQAWMQPQNQLLGSSLTTIISPREPCGVHTHSYARVNGLSPSSSPQEPSRLTPGSGSRYLPGLSSPCNAAIPLSTSFPHSLSFSGYSATSPLQGTSYSSPCATGNYAITQQPSAAASFFARAAQRLNLSSKKRRRHHSTADGESVLFQTNFAEIIRSSPPPAPPALLRTSGRKDVTGLGKVKVMLRICPLKQGQEMTGSSVLNVDQRKKQVTVYESSSFGGVSTPAERRVGVSAPKMFAFDAIFSQDDTQAEVCSSSLTEVIQAVVNGIDGCLFVYGQSKLGKSYTMVGGSESTRELGIIPCAISWLFRLINDQKQKTGARFSVRVSAVEIVGRNEALKDLLAEQAAGTEGSGPSPAVYLRDDPVFGTRLMNQSELRAPTAEKAAYLLDAAIAARANADGEDEGRNAHFMLTLHVYQYRVEKGGKGGVAGGRSRLHLFDLGSCERQSKPREGGTSGCLTLSALGNVILALFNGQKHVPYKDSKLTQLLREALGSLTCRAAMLAHVSPLPEQYAETLSTIQLAARIHRMRRKKLKYLGMSSEEEKGAVSRPFVRSHAVTEDGAGKSMSSDPDYTSSSEQSCDTVIYVGATGQLTDNEGPPSFLPILAKMNKTPPSQKLQEAKPSGGEDATASPGGRSALSNIPPTNLVADTVNNKNILATPERGSTEGSSKGQTQRSKTNVKKSRVVQVQKQDQGGGGSDCGARSTSGSNKNTKVQSDELWIDRPRFSKPRFDSRTLHGLQKEQWVDGPAVNYGLMDDHKQDMIRRWVEEHSSHVQAKKGSRAGKKEIWIDFPSSGGRDELAKVVDASSLRHWKAGHEGQGTKRSAKCERAQEETKIEAVEVAIVARLEVAESETEDVEPAEESIDVAEQEEPVQMQDSCLQVCEEDILTACWLMDDSSVSENQQHEMDRESLDEHPLRVLSAEGLNLASSFADSRSVMSGDIDCASVPDECRRYIGGDGGLSWRLLQRGGPGGQCRLPSYQEAVAQKLERLARLRENSLRNASKFCVSDDLNLRTSGENSSPSAGILNNNNNNNMPARTARLTMSEMLYGSQDSSLDELSAEDVTSIHSEPAEMDLDRWDLRFNVKPMNGLKLEAFYNRLYNTTSFLERAMQAKPGYGSRGLSVPRMEGYQKILSPGKVCSKTEDEKTSSLERRRNMITSLRHPDGASNPNLSRHPSVTQLNVQIETTNLLPGKPQRSPGNGASSSDVEDNLPCCTQKPLVEEKSPSIEKEILGASSMSERQLLVVGQSPTSRMSKLSKFLGSRDKNCSPKHSKSSPKSSPKMSHKQASPTPSRHQSSSNMDMKVASPVRIPTRSSPTSSSSGTLVMCCNSGRAGKNKRPFPPLPTSRHSPKLDKHKKSESKCKTQQSKSKLLARSSSSPVTSCDEKEEECGKKRTGLPSPYALITKAKVHQHSSSGHGSDSSITSGGREGKEPLMKGMKGGGQQCSGTSSGYESMLRDSEGTPLSSSSQDSECDDLTEGRGRKGKRKKTQGSTKRSQSAPARVPNEGVPLQQSQSAAIDQQPMPSRGRGFHRRRNNGQMRRSEEEVCCTGLLCCRLLDFY